MVHLNYIFDISDFNVTLSSRIIPTKLESCNIFIHYENTHLKIKNIKRQQLENNKT